MCAARMQSRVDCSSTWINGPSACVPVLFFLVGCNDATTDPPAFTYPPSVAVTTISTDDRRPAFYGTDPSSEKVAWLDKKQSGFFLSDQYRFSVESGQIDRAGLRSQWHGEVLEWHQRTDGAWQRVRCVIHRRQLGDVFPVGGAVARLVSLDLSRPSRFADSLLTLSLLPPDDASVSTNAYHLGLVLEVGLATSVTGLGVVTAGKITTTAGEPSAVLWFADGQLFCGDEPNYPEMVRVHVADVIRRKWSDGVVAGFRVREIVPTDAFRQVRGWVVLDCVGLSDPAPQPVREALVDPIASKGPVRNRIELTPSGAPLPTFESVDH